MLYVITSAKLYVITSAKLYVITSAKLYVITIAKLYVITSAKLFLCTFFIHVFILLKMPRKKMDFCWTRQTNHIYITFGW
jgi:hypothetical protein